MFCKHQWKEIARTYAEPYLGDIKGWISNGTFERHMFGLTTILWECQICHKIRKEEMLGKEIVVNQNEKLAVNK